ncbi:MAG TPA: HDIG domain-containing protein, partial [Thermoanaerobaculia bacterium]|nr:HDIG domain-containing protein [Thermoanaerobaculia bacterium]
VTRASRTRPEGRAARFTRGARDAWWRLLESPAVWVPLFLLIGTWSLAGGGLFGNVDVEAGSIAPRDFIAPTGLDIIDAAATRDRRLAARNEVLPVYDLDSAVIGEREAAFERLFAEGRRLVGSDPERLRQGGDWRQRLAERLEEASGLDVEPAQAEVLASWAFAPDLEDRVRGVTAQALRRGVVAAKERLLENRMRGITLRDLGRGAERHHVDLYEHLGYPDEVLEFLDAEVRNWLGLSAAERQALVGLLHANIPPNLHPNRSDTLARQEAAAAAVQPVRTRVSKGEVIVRQGDRIDQATAELLSEIAADRRWNRRWLPLGGMLLLLGLTAGGLWVAMRRDRVADHGRKRVFGESLLLLLLALLGTRLCFLIATALAASFDRPPLDSFQSYVYAVPFAALALVAALLLGRGPALVLSVVFSVLVSALAIDEGAMLVFYGLAGSLAAIFALERYRFEQRLVMGRVGLLVAAVNVLAVLVITGLHRGLGAGAAGLAFDLVCALVGGVLAAAAAGFALPLLESLLGLTTDIKLVELANTNLPLLRRLAFEAPGTFQHSLMVANLAKEGCETIGADATLAYTGALYHDIGKVFRPEYFIENQRPGHNLHDRLLPSMSALILINHIKEGVDLARKHGLPQPIIDAIEQHHGTRLIKYFYNRALERSDPDTDEVREEKYRYPGPKPHDKVMGVLMLADGVEAASRTLVEPSPVKIRTLIRTIFDDCLRDGQLDHTDLTLSDLRRVAEAFLRVLTTIFHQRIDYPGFDFNAPESGAAGAERGAAGSGPQRAVAERRRPERTGANRPNAGRSRPRTEEPEEEAAAAVAAARGQALS